MDSFAVRIKRNLSNSIGKSIRKKIVVIESDDWGAIRMSSKEAFQSLYANGIKPFDDDEARYLKNDALASEDDLISLFETLDSFKDKKGNSPVFTIVGVVANPSFEEIRKREYLEYVFEPFTETLKKYPRHNNSFNLWKEGIANNIFVPQFHGREHLNVYNWLKALQLGEKDTLKAFEYGVYGITPRKMINHVSYQAAFDFYHPNELAYQETIISEGLLLFEKLFNYKASFFVPTNGPFNNGLMKTLAEHDIKYVGVSKIQNEPLGYGKTAKRYHFIGQRNMYNQLFLTRNCIFEPSSNLKTDWVDSCLNDINIAFKWNKPAVISTHRVNYVGFINPSNKDNGIRQLKKLIHEIIKRWPEVEFHSSSNLGEHLSKYR